MSGMHTHNNMIVSEVLRMTKEVETKISVEDIIIKAKDIVTDLAGLKDVEVRYEIKIQKRRRGVAEERRREKETKSSSVVDVLL